MKETHRVWSETKPKIVQNVRIWNLIGVHTGHTHGVSVNWHKKSKTFAFHTQLTGYGHGHRCHRTITVLLKSYRTLYSSVSYTIVHVTCMCRVCAHSDSISGYAQRLTYRILCSYAPTQPASILLLLLFRLLFTHVVCRIRSFFMDHYSLSCNSRWEVASSPPPPPSSCMCKFTEYACPLLVQHALHSSGNLIKTAFLFSLESLKLLEYIGT